MCISWTKRDITTLIEDSEIAYAKPIESIPNSKIKLENVVWNRNNYKFYISVV